MRQTTVILLCVLAASLLSLWFFNTHERVSREKYIGYQGEARVNDLLAAQMLLQKLDFDAESLASFTPTGWLPPQYDTIVIGLVPSIAIGEERTAILDWVSGGGHLILLPGGETGQDVDEFLTTLGFAVTFSEEEVELDIGDDGQADAVADRPEEAPMEYDDEYDLFAYWGDRDIEVLDPTLAAEVVSDQGMTIAARRDWDDGVITVLSSSSYFLNSNLEYGDNARLLADIVVGNVEPGKVWLIYQTTFRPLWKIIWQAAPYLVLGLSLLFILWLWAALPVFGPRIREQVSERRSIVEHIRAAGVFVWRHDGGDGLAQSAIQALLHEAEARHPGIGRQTKQNQAEHIARMSGMSVQKVMDVLDGQTDLRPREFTQSMQRLQSIRKEL